jgi:hypothetical protein
VHLADRDSIGEGPPVIRVIAASLAQAVARSGRMLLKRRRIAALIGRTPVLSTDEGRR